MPPDQSQADTNPVEPANEPALPSAVSDNQTEAAELPPNNDLTVQSTQTLSAPTSGVLSEPPADNQDGLPSVDNALSASQPVVQNQVNTQPQTTHIDNTLPLSNKDGMKKEEPPHTKLKRLLILLIFVATLLLIGIAGFLYWYSLQDHSIYAKLSNESYSRSNVTLHFLYPSIMSTDASAVNSDPDMKVAFQYESGLTKLAIVAGVIPYSTILQHFAMTPAQELIELKTGQGSYAAAIKNAQPTLFSTLYNNCSWLYTNSGEKDLLCAHQNANDSGNTTVNISGADANYQYVLTIGMTNNIWTKHRQVWQKVEKSFTY